MRFVAQLTWFCLLVALFAVAQDAVPDSAGKSSSKSLPAVSEIMNKLLTHQREIEQVRKNYLFIMEEDEQEPDGHGGLRLKQHNTYEVHYEGPWVVQNLVARNGKPLSAEEMARQRQESSREMRQARQSLARLQSDPDANGNENLKLSDFLAADRFTNLRREQFRGQETLVLDFEPNPDFRPRRAIEKVLKNLAGRIWIDEHDFHGIRLEAHLQNDVSFGGFLASLKRGTAIVFEQQRVNSEIWLPSYSEIHLDGRAFLSSKHIHLVQHFSNYRRFRVETVINPNIGDAPPLSVPTASSGTGGQ